MGARAAVYARISDDHRGDAAGVRRQRDDCRALAADRGWTVGHAFTDNDRSAYSGKPRPGYARLCEVIGSGDVDVVVAWHPDRLHRSPLELEHFLDLVEARRVAVETVRAGPWDLSSPAGRLTARQLGAVARYESEHRSERVRRALEQSATDGRSHGRTTFGWSRVYDSDTGRGRDVVDTAQAAVIQEIADRIISGDSLRAIVGDLNDRGVPSPSGRPWQRNMARALVLRERNVGLRVHRGEVVGNGAWAPILERAAWDQVRAVLGDPQRRTSVSSGAKHLLSGIARCGVCGAPVRATVNRGVPAYMCRHVARKRADVDDLVTRVLVARLSAADAAAALVPDDSGDRKDAADEAAALRVRLDVAADDYADGKIDRRQLERITARLRPQVEAAEARARVVDDSPLLAGIVGPDAATAWEGLPLTRRRALVDLLMEVTILRTRPGAREFDPESVGITWRTP